MLVWLFIIWLFVGLLLLFKPTDVVVVVVITVVVERGFTPVGDSKIVDRAGPPEEEQVVTATLENISESLFCKFPPLKK